MSMHYSNSAQAPAEGRGLQKEALEERAVGEERTRAAILRFHYHHPLLLLLLLLLLFLHLLHRRILRPLRMKSQRIFGIKYVEEVLPCVAVCCRVLQCVAVCCRVLQCVVVCYGVLQTDGVFRMRGVEEKVEICLAYVLQCVAVCCSVLQRVAVCCGVLQGVAACCSA